MPLVYRLLADLIVIVHAAYVLFVVLGLMATLVGIWRRWNWVRNPLFRYSHLAMILIVVAEAWAGITCPLTTWEQWLREWSGGESYRGDFIPNLVHNLLFFDAAPWVFTMAYSLFGAAVLATFLLAPPQRRAATKEDQVSEFDAPGHAL
ncbi:MAG: DUF2784 domain-containing protein [Planctomycetaceae bacterium]|nr:DUF2784 domain-containing protein [Planctomycetaceae bacterium]